VKADFQQIEIPGIDIIGNGKESDTKQPQSMSRVTREKNPFNPRFSIWISTTYRQKLIKKIQITHFGWIFRSN
jgi:hypothetical protein